MYVPIAHDETASHPIKGFSSGILKVEEIPWHKTPSAWFASIHRAEGWNFIPKYPKPPPPGSNIHPQSNHNKSVSGNGEMWFTEKTRMCEVHTVNPFQPQFKEVVV